MLGSSSGETDKTKPCHEHLGLASALRVNVWPMCSASVQTASKVELPATTRRSPAQSAAGALEDHPEKWREKVQALQAPSSLPRALPGLGASARKRSAPRWSAGSKRVWLHKCSMLRHVRMPKSRAGPSTCCRSLARV